MPPRVILLSRRRRKVILTELQQGLQGGADAGHDPGQGGLQGGRQGGAQGEGVFHFDGEDSHLLRHGQPQLPAQCQRFTHAHKVRNGVGLT